MVSTTITPFVGRRYDIWYWVADTVGDQ